MYLTEEDVKKKCCPVMTRVDKNEPIVSDKIIKCIVSNCIMWRWKRDMREPYSLGYCGLASKPEE
jgi:hypothetical protein